MNWSSGVGLNYHSIAHELSVETMMQKPKATCDDLANHDLVTIAVYLLGGSTRPIDTEDIAIKTNDLAPGRFTWQKYKDQISLDSVRKRLWDAQSEDKGFLYLTGSERDGWMLTQKGVDFAKVNVARLSDHDLSGERIRGSDRKWRDRERVRLLASDAFMKIRDGNSGTITFHDAATFFRLDEYVTGTARERKIARVVNAFYDDAELGPAVKIILDMLNEPDREEIHER